MAVEKFLPSFKVVSGAADSATSKTESTGSQPKEKMASAGLKETSQHQTMEMERKRADVPA